MEDCRSTILTKEIFCVCSTAASVLGDRDGAIAGWSCIEIGVGALVCNLDE